MSTKLAHLNQDSPKKVEATINQVLTPNFLLMTIATLFDALN
ncbi:34176_t:CDS:2, partial [Gigaspora margarita]